MKTTLEAQEQKAYLLSEAFDIAKNYLRYRALEDEIKKEKPGTEELLDIYSDLQSRLTEKEFSCLSLLFEQNARYERLEVQGYNFHEIDRAFMGAKRLIERAQEAGEITDEVFGECP